MQNQNKLSTRLLSLALSAAMALTTFPVAAFAVEGDTAPQATSGNTTTTRAITAFGELGEGFEKPVSFDGHTYVLNVNANTPFAEVKLPTELSVTVEKTTTTTPLVKDEPVAEPVAEPTAAPVAEPVAEPTAEPVAEPKQENTVVVETAPENLAVTWKGDKEYTATENSTVAYTPVLPEGYALKDGVVLPTINVVVGKKALAPVAPMAAMPRAATPVKRTTTLDLTAASISYMGTDGTTPKTANPTTTSIADTGEGWAWDQPSTTLTLSGANINSTTDAVTHVNCAIRLPNNAIIVLTEGTNNTVVSGGIQNGSYGIGVSDGTLTINGTGSLNATSAGNTYNSFGIYAKTAININGGTITAAANPGDGGGDYVGIRADGNVTITGGTVASSGKTAAIKVKQWSGTIIAADAAVTGATEKFKSGETTKLTQAVPTTPVKISFPPIINNATTLQAAIDAAGEGETIKLTANIDLTTTGVTVKADKAVNFTIDLNGHNLTSSVTTITHNGTGALTITDSVGAGILNTTSRSATTNYTINNAGTGTVSVANVTVSADKVHTIYNATTGTINVSGGTVSSDIAFAIYNYGRGTVNVSGGTVKSNAGAICNENLGLITVSGNASVTSTCSKTYEATILLKFGIDYQDVIKISDNANITNTGGGGASTIKNQNSGTISMTGGTVSSINTATAIFNTLNGEIKISGGTVRAANGTAIWNAQAATNTISGNAKVTSKRTDSSSGTVHFVDVPSTADEIILYVKDNAIVENTAALEGFSAWFPVGSKPKGHYSVVSTAKLGKVSPETMSVTFDARNGGTIADVDIDTAMTLPADPTWTGYTFGGWYDGIDGTDAAGAGGFSGELTLEKAKALTANTTVYAKWTKGGKVVRTTPLDLTGAVTAAANQGWTWANKTLTLDGANIDCSGLPVSEASIFGIKLPNDATIALATGSTNTVKSGTTTGDDKYDGRNTYGIETVGNLTINGKGTLYANGGTAGPGVDCSSYGIRSTAAAESTITINGGTIYATGSNVTGDRATSVGIYTNYTLAITDGAVVNAEGKAVTSAKSQQLSAGISVNALTMTGGALNGVGGDAGTGVSTGNSYSNGVSVWNSMKLSGTAVVTGKGQTSAIESNNPITAAFATVTGANEPFTSGTTKILTQIDATIPVEISFGPFIAVAAQSGTATYGTGASPTFVVSNNNFGGKYPKFAPKFEWVGTAPTGVTTAITGTNKETLTVTTTAETLAGDYKFKVVSPKASPETGNYESAEATLTVDKLTATITWAGNSFAYNGKEQVPTATVSNKVGTDDVTVTVAGKQTNVGTNYTATASAFEGAAAANYKLPTTKPTTTFAITAITVTVNDGTLEVKKAFDGTTVNGTATGKLGLTGVLGIDDVSVAVVVGDYADATVGKGKTVTLTILLTGLAASNYTLDSVATYEFKNAEITKAAYTDTPAGTPESTPEKKGDKSITIKPVTPPTGEDVEYAISTTNTPPTPDKDWQTGTTFNNLKPNTEYFFFARVKEGTNHAAGGVSAGVSITTDRSDYTGTPTTAPTATKTHDTVTLNTQTISGETVEYGIENSSGTIIWQDRATFDNLASDTEYKFYTRVKANGTHKAGATSAATTIKTKKAPVDVKGTVTDSKGTTPIANVTVELKQGDTVIKSATTAADGSYTLSAVPAGVYKLVITKGIAPNTVTITETVTVDGTPITGKNVKFLEGDKNTIVDSKPGAPTVAVDGMNDLLNDTNINKTLTPAEKAAVDANGSVELKFTADLKPLNENATDKSELESIAGNQKIDLLLDLSVLKIVKDASGKTITDGEKITNLAGLITVHLPIPANMQGKAGLSLYRMHNGKPEKLSTTADANGEYYTIDTSGEFMTLYLKKFSTYAMGYNAFTVAMQNGGTGASGNGNYSNGDVVTISAGTKSGYSFSGWTVTVGNATLVNPSSATTTFTMPAENIVITANWTATGGSTGGNGSSSGTYYYIKATAGIGGSINTSERVKVQIGESAGFSITPDKGYQIADVKVNGKSIGAKKYYVFTNVLSDQTIHATFKKAGHANPQTGVDVD